MNDWPESTMQKNQKRLMNGSVFKHESLHTPTSIGSGKYTSRSTDSRFHCQRTSGAESMSFSNIATKKDEEDTCKYVWYIDFLPRRLNETEAAASASFETFDILVNRGDSWLAQNPHYELVNCETIDRKVCLIKEIYSESLLFNDSEQDDSPDQIVHIKALRLWYKCSNNTKLNATLGSLLYKDFVPHHLNPGAKRPLFESLPMLIDRINQELSENPINGHVISAETVPIKMSASDWLSQCWLISRKCKWYDEYNTHKLSFIRVFYRSSYPCVQRLGVKDFIPEVLDEGGIFSPAKYSTFTSLLRKSTEWINKSQDITVLNIQTLYTKHRKKSECSGDTKRFKTEDLFENSIETRFRAFFIRVSFKETLSPESLYDTILYFTTNYTHNHTSGLNNTITNTSKVEAAAKNVSLIPREDQAYGHLQKRLSLMQQEDQDYRHLQSCPEVLSAGNSSSDSTSNFDNRLYYRRPKLICKTYIPVKHSYGYENIIELVERAEKELKSLNAKIYYIETVCLPEWMTNPDIIDRGERTYYDGEWYFLPDQDGNELGPFRYRCLYIIRVYFDCPPLHKALQQRLSMYSVHNSCCVLL